MNDPPNGGNEFFRRQSEDHNSAVLARIDERTKNTNLRVADLAKEISSLRDQISQDYVGRPEFKSLVDKVSLHQRILFSAIGLICLSVMAAVLALVVNNHG